MAQHQAEPDQERRSDVRLASDKKIDAVLVDRHDQPIAAFEDVQVVNVSAGGMMLVSNQSAQRGARLVVNLDNPGRVVDGAGGFRLEAMACSPHAQGSHKHRIRCRLVQGAIPAKLIHGW